MSTSEFHGVWAKVVLLGKELRDWFASIPSWFAAKDVLPGKSITLRRAEEFAKLLLSKGVDKVLLFGSTVRTGDGEDIDIIAEVQTALADEFLEELIMADRCRDKREGTYEFVYTRFVLAREHLGISDRETDQIRNGSTLVERTAWGCHSRKFWNAVARGRMPDIFLFPKRWQDDLVLEARLPEKDPDFLQNIARDVRCFDANSGTFRLGFWHTYFGKLPRRWGLLGREVGRWCHHLYRRGWRLFWRIRYRQFRQQPASYRWQ